MSSSSVPLQIKCLQKSKQLEIHFSDEIFSLPHGYLRFHSPSADGAIERSQAEAAEIVALEPVGHYAIKLKFSDGHDTGIYSWEKLHALGVQWNKEQSTHE